MSYTIDRSEWDAVEAVTAEVATVDVAALSEGRHETAPLLPVSIRRLSAGWVGAEWVRYVVDYQDAESEGYATLDAVYSDHELDGELDLDWQPPTPIGALDIKPRVRAPMVFSLDTGERLAGFASDELTRQSAAAGDSGAVPAHRDDAGTWQYVAPGDTKFMADRGYTIVTVWVAE